MKKYLLIILSAFSVIVATAQVRDKWFMSVGGTLLTDYSQTTGLLDQERVSFDNRHISYASVVFNGRMNIVEFSNNFSLSLGVMPTLSVGRVFNEINFNTNLSFRMPMLADFNFGTSSTTVTRSDFGFTIGGGFEYVKYPLLGTVIVAQLTGVDRFVSFKSQWLQPVVNIGFKYFGRNRYCREINIRLTKLEKSSLVNESNASTYGTVTKFTSMGVMVSYLHYLNY